MRAPVLLVVAVCIVALTIACGTPVGGGNVVVVVNGTDCSGEQECAFDFGDVPVTTTQKNTFTIKNAGDNGTDIGNITIDGDPTFTVEGKAGDLSAHATTTATVSFSPTTVSSSSAQLVVKWDGGSSTTSISLTGKGK